MKDGEKGELVLKYLSQARRRELLRQLQAFAQENGFQRNPCPRSPANLADFDFEGMEEPVAGQDAPVNQEPTEIKENEHQCKEPEKENQSPTETRAGENHQPVRNP